VPPAAISGNMTVVDKVNVSGVTPVTPIVTASVAREFAAIVAAFQKR
jgi:hypothetical protein